MNKINVSDLILEESSELEFSIKVDSLGEDIKLTSPLFVSGKIIKLDYGVLAEGKMKGEEEAVCDRCGSTFLKKIVGYFSQEYLLPGKSTEEKAYEEKAGYVISEKNEIDLKEVILEEVFLRDQSKLLCNKKCRGLCSKCGKNLNKGDCSCYTKEQTNSSFARLKELKERK